MSRLVQQYCYVAHNRLTMHCIHVDIRQTSCVNETRVLKVKTNVFTTGLVNMLLMTQCQVARCSKKHFKREDDFNAFPGKPEILHRSNFENLSCSCMQKSIIRITNPFYKILLQQT